jgi:deazaflavin-dependent oxidoreductase (nitroreductase family)
MRILRVLAAYYIVEDLLELGRHRPDRSIADLVAVDRADRQDFGNPLRRLTPYATIGACDWRRLWLGSGHTWGDRQLSRGKAMSYNRDWDAFNRDVIVEFRANGGKVGDRKYPLILLTTTGAKSGLPHTTPLNYSTDSDRIIVIASKAAAPTHPDWYHNLVAHPEATIELGAEQFPVRARVAEGQERERQPWRLSPEHKVISQVDGSHRLANGSVYKTFQFVNA